MRRAEDFRRLLRRADHRAVLVIAALLLAAIAAQAILVYAFVAVESLEEADRRMADALAVSRQQPPGDSYAIGSNWETLRSLFDPRASIRVLGRDGRVLDARGEWPLAERRVPTDDGERRFRDFLHLRPDHYLTGALSLAGGERVELALPLSPFYEEVREVGLALALLAGISGVTALLVAALAMRWAFAPLRCATRLVEGIDARKIGQRLPTSGTGDPVDRHAKALNRVLADADVTFDRLRAFSADVAHELRTPLNRLQNVAEVALLSGDDSELKPALERVHAAGEELSRTVQSLMLLAELDDHRVEPKPVDVDLDAWLARAVDLYAPLFDEQHSELRQCGRAGTIEVDRVLLDRVLTNLLDNALVHAAGRGAVELRAARGEAGVTIEVDDSGPGIPDAMRERIFDRFTRVDRARSGSGTGLGLAVARACARASGGDLCVGDSQLGGACFVWRLLAPADRPAGD